MMITFTVSYAGADEIDVLEQALNSYINYWCKRDPGTQGFPNAENFKNITQAKLNIELLKKERKEPPLASVPTPSLPFLAPQYKLDIKPEAESFELIPIISPEVARAKEKAEEEKLLRKRLEWKDWEKKRDTLWRTR
jgi:hypothetical protein